MKKLSLCVLLVFLSLDLSATIALKNTLWPAGSHFHVKYLQATQAQKDYFEKYIPLWFRYTNLSITFPHQKAPSQSNVYELRVQFHTNLAYSSSSTGLLGHRRVKPNEAHITVSPHGGPVELLHEFGHFLGLGHEFHNPIEGVIFNKTLVKEKYCPEVFGLQNVSFCEHTILFDYERAKKYPHIYVLTKFDPFSVMNNYGFESRSYVFEPGSPTPMMDFQLLSLGDRLGIYQLYPRKDISQEIITDEYNQALPEFAHP